MALPTSAPLGTEFFARDSLEVARDLLGCVLVRGAVALRLTEVEAYRGVGEDPGSHSYRGRTPRNATMFGPAGQLYVYFTYGMHWCANLVCGDEGESRAVLLRAGEVVAGADVVAERRPGLPVRDWARGPARLTRALDIDGSLDGAPVVVGRADAPALTVHPPDRAVDPMLVRAGPRVGVAGPGGNPDLFPWRFWLDGASTVSAYRPGRPPRGRGPSPRLT